jgi:hypothetical protein
MDLSDLPTPDDELPVPPTPQRKPIANLDDLRNSAGIGKAYTDFDKTVRNIPQTAVTDILGAPSDIANLVNSVYYRGMDRIFGTNTSAGVPKLPGGSQDIQKWIAKQAGTTQNDIFGAADPNSAIQQYTSGVGQAAVTGGRGGVASYAGQSAAAALGAPEEVQAMAAVASPAAAENVANLPHTVLKAALTDADTPGKIAQNENISGGNPGTVGMVGTPLANQVQSILSKLPGSSSRIYDQVNQFYGSIRDRFNGIVNNISDVSGAQVAGNEVKNGITAYDQQQKDLAKTIYQQAADNVPAGTEVNMQPLLDAADAASTAVRGNDKLNKGMQSGTQRQLETRKGLVLDAALDYGIKKHEDANGQFTSVTDDMLQPTTAVSPAARLRQTLPDGTQLYQLGNDVYGVQPGQPIPRELAVQKPPAVDAKDVVTLPDGRNVLRSEAQPVLDKIAQNPVLPYDQARDIHTTLGDQLSDPSLISQGLDAGAIKRVWGGSKQGLSAAIGDTPAGRLHSLADSLYEQQSERRDLLNPVLSKATTSGPEGIFKAAQQNAKDTGSGTVFREMFAGAGEQGKPVLVATLLDHMGKFDSDTSTRTQDALWSPTQFVRNWGTLNGDAKTAIASQLGPDYVNAVNQLDAFVAQQVKTKAVTGNPSGTAQATRALSTAGTALSGLWAMLNGHPMVGASALAGVAGGLALSNAVARGMTNPHFVRWLVNAKDAPPNAIPGMIMQLAAVGAQTKDPDIQLLAQTLQAQTNGNPPGSQ